MRIECPACAAAYEVPDRLLAGSARTLRCSRCGADFALPRHVAAESVPATAEPTAPPEAEPSQPPEPDPPPAAIVEPPRGPLAELPASHALAPIPEAPSPALVRAWTASIAVVAGAVIAFFYFQAKVMAVWPASTRLYAALGLT